MDRDELTDNGVSCELNKLLGVDNWILAGSGVLKMNYCLDREVGDIDIIVKETDQPLIKTLQFPEFIVSIHESIYVETNRKRKVDIMVVDPFWKILTYWDSYLVCRVQLIDQIIWIMEHVVANNMTSSPEKRIKDLEHINNIKLWNKRES